MSTDPTTHRQAYTLVESPFGHEHHNASLEVCEHEAGCRLVWTTDLLPDALADAMRESLAAEFATIVDRLT